MFNIGDKVRLKTLDEIGDHTPVMMHTQKDLIDNFGTGLFVVDDVIDDFILLTLVDGGPSSYKNSSRFALFEEPHVFDVDGLEKLI